VSEANDSPTEFGAELAWLGAFLKQEHAFPNLRRDRLLAEWSRVQQQDEQAHHPLRVLLLGGTGVGKSTLVNAIAGMEEMAETSAVQRPCTQHTTFYYHAEADLSGLDGAIRQDDNRRPHHVRELRRLIFIDPPDFDTTVLANRRRVATLLDAAELVFCLMTEGKYRTLRYQELLTQYRRKKSFIFLLNKADVIKDWDRDRLLQDVRGQLDALGFVEPRVLSISAAGALARKLRGGMAPPADRFAELEAIIYQELNEKRAREIRRVNLRGSLARLLEEIERDIGTPLPALAAAVDSLIAERLGRLNERLAAIVQQALLERLEAPVKQMLRETVYDGFGGPFGLYLQLAGRWQMHHALPAGPAGFSPRRIAREATEEVRTEKIAQCISDFWTETVDALERTGLAADPLDKPDIPEDTTRELAAHVADDLGTRIEQLWRVASQRVTTFRAACYNLVPVGFLGAALYIIIAQYVHGAPVGLNFFLSTLAIFIVLAYLEKVLLDAGIRRQTDALYGSLRTDVRALAHLCSPRHVTESLHQFADHLRTVAQRFQQVKARCLGSAAPPSQAPARETERFPAAAETAEDITQNGRGEDS